MATYTVQKGDTLSGIASKLGLGSYNQLSGYRSGNPNLIYPGEVLSYGGSTPAPAPAPAAAPSGPTELQSFADRMAAEQKALLAKQKAEQDSLFGQYTQQLNSQEKLPDMYGRLQEQLGIPGLTQSFQNVQGEIYNVKDMLDRLDENVTSRALGTMTTEAQRQRQIAAEGDPLRTALARLGTGLEPIAQALSGAQGQLSTLLQLNVQQQDKDMKPIELQINSLSDRFAREMTGFTESKQTTLDALMDKINRDRQLSDREWQLAQQLAAEERDFARQKELAKIQASAAANYLPANTGYNYGTPASQGSSLNLSQYMPTTSTLRVSNSPTMQLIQPSSSGISLQGGGGLNLQGGSGLSLQGGGGINLQGGTLRLQ